MKIHLLPFLLLMFLFQACDKDSVPAWHLFEDDLNINFIGDTSTLTIEDAQGELRLYIGNDNIIEAWMVGNQLIISAKEYGSTYVRINDNKGHYAVINVLISHKIRSIRISDSGVFVTGSDEILCEEIRNELLPSLFEQGWLIQLKYLETYSGELEIIKSPDNSEKGSFEDLLSAYRLILEGGSHYFERLFNEQPRMTSVGPAEFYYKEDFTEVYQKLYPNADIEEVRIIMRVSVWDQIER